MAIENETEDSNKAKAPSRRTKGEVNYSPGVDGEDCLACENFKQPDRCAKVRGEISPTGTCDLWESPSSVDGLEFGDSESIEDILFGPAGEE